MFRGVGWNHQPVYELQPVLPLNEDVASPGGARPPTSGAILDWGAVPGYQEWGQFPLLWFPMVSYGFSIWMDLNKSKSIKTHVFSVWKSIGSSISYLPSFFMWKAAVPGSWLVPSMGNPRVYWRSTKGLRLKTNRISSKLVDGWPSLGWWPSCYHFFQEVHGWPSLCFKDVFPLRLAMFDGASHLGLQGGGTWPMSIHWWWWNCPRPAVWRAK